MQPKGDHLLQNQDVNIINQTSSLPNLHASPPPGAWITGAATVAAIAALAYAVKRYAPPKNPDSQGPPPQFTNENITASFVAAIPSITRELNLEVATATQTETFTQSSSKTLLWGLMDLGTNVVQARVPVTYRYHIQLREPWELNISDNQVLVTAPILRASLPPAIHTDQIERLSMRGWGRGSPAELLKQLEQQITPALAEHAANPKQLNQVREACRSSVAEFVRLWLEREGQWRLDRFTAIQVRFADEATLSPDSARKFLS